MLSLRNPKLTSRLRSEKTSRLCAESPPLKGASLALPGGGLPTGGVVITPSILSVVDDELLAFANNDGK